MIVDSSAVLAILYAEPEAKRFEMAILSAANRRMSIANVLEASIAIGRRVGAEGCRQLDTYLEDASIELVPVTLDQLEVAREAWRRFGKGNHSAALNFGDCFAYALAGVSGEPLLFKGDDFPLTDIKAA